MIIRYRASMSSGGGSTTKVLSNTFISGTANTGNWEIVVQGPPSAVVGFKVTGFTSFGVVPENKINGSDYVLNQTFSLTLDAITGKTTITQMLSIANVAGNRINVQVTIESVSVGGISVSSNFWTNFVLVP